MSGFTKGQGFITMAELVRERLGADDLARFRAALRTETRQAIDNPPLPMAWLDAAIYFDFINVLEQTVWHTQPGKIVQFGEDRMRRDLSSVYRVLLRFVSVKTVVGKVPSIWQTYTRDVGELSVTQDSDTSAIATYKNIALANAGWWLFQRGVIAGTLKTTGAKNVESELIDGGGTQPNAVLRLRWS